jgi:hypothetical protein
MARKTITILATLAVFAATATTAEARHLATGNLKANIFAQAVGGTPTIFPIQCINIWIQGNYAYYIAIGTKHGICSEVQGGDAVFLEWNAKKAIPNTGHQTGWVVLSQGDEETCKEPAHAGNIPLATLVNLLGCK